MKNHTRVYMDFFGMTGAECVACELCGTVAMPRMLDVHHVVYRSAGGGDNIENLVGLCRDCHDAAHASQSLNASLAIQAANLEERLECYNISQRMIDEDM